MAVEACCRTLTSILSLQKDPEHFIFLLKFAIFEVQSVVFEWRQLKIEDKIQLMPLAEELVHLCNNIIEIIGQLQCRDNCTQLCKQRFIDVVNYLRKKFKPALVALGYI